MTILCGVDFSEQAGRAAEVAARLAAASKEALWLVHVREGQPSDEPAREAQELERARRRLEGEVKALNALAEVHIELRAGLPDEQLLEAARERDARLIVVGAVGRRSAQHTKLGSVADLVARAADRALLVVRDSRPLLAWLKEQRPLKVLLGVEGGESSRLALQWTSTLRQVAPCDVLAARVYWAPEERERLGGVQSISFIGQNPELEAVLSRELSERLQELSGKGTVRSRISASFGRASDFLLEVAEEEGSELVVVGAHHRSRLDRLWYGSVSQALTHGANASVLRVPGRSERLTDVEDVLRVLVPVDFSEVSERAVGRACSVLARGGRLRLVHVEPPRGRAAGEDEVLGRLRALIPAEAAARGLVAEVAVVAHAHAADGICQAAEQFGADFVCMGTHGRGRLARMALGSVADSVLQRTRRPVIFVKPALKD